MADEADVAMVQDETAEAMEKSITSLRRDLQKVRTGRASTALLDGIQVDYFGTATPLNQLANLKAPDARLIVIAPYDKSAIQAIERAIQTSDLGLTTVQPVENPLLIELAPKAAQLLGSAHPDASSRSAAIEQPRASAP